MKAILLVGLGGALGSIARYGLSSVAHVPHWRLPVGVITVNVIGCLIAGVLAGLIVRHELISADLRVFLFVGLLGGFTTFSAFGIETLALLRKGDFGIAASYVLLSVALSLAAVWLGFVTINR